MKNISVRKNLLKLFTVIFIICFVYLTSFAIFRSCQDYHKMNTAIIIVGVVVFFVILYFLDKLFSNLSPKALLILDILFVVLMIILQIVFIVYLRVRPSWDFGAINQYAYDFANGKRILPDYYSWYPNNIGATLVLGYMYKAFLFILGRQYNYIKLGYIFNVLVIEISILLTYLFVRKALNKSKATLFLFFILFVSPFYVYSQIVYTDTMTMLFPIFMLLLLLGYNEGSYDDNKKIMFLKLILIGVLGAIGAILKSNIEISLIAIVIYILFTTKLKRSISSIVLILIPFIIITMFSHSLFSRYLPIDYSKAGFPYTHWLMMGVHGKVGDYSSDDVANTKKLYKEQGKEAVKEYNISEIKKKLSDFGPKGYLKFLDNKLKFTWNDGTYYALNKLNRFPYYKGRLFNHTVKGKNGLLVYSSQISYSVMMISILIAAIGYFKKPEHFSRIALLNIFGTFVFLTLWETRSRYLVCILPVMLITAFFGFNLLFKLINGYLSSRHVKVH